MAYKHAWAVTFAFCLIATAMSFPFYERNPFRVFKTTEEERKRNVICPEVEDKPCTLENEATVCDNTGCPHGLAYVCEAEVVSYNPVVKEWRCTQAKR